MLPTLPTALLKLDDNHCKNHHQIVIQHPVSSSTTLSSRWTSSIMGRSTVKIGALLVIMLGLMYTTWQIYLPRYTRDRLEFDVNSDGSVPLHPDSKFSALLTNNLIGAEDSQDRILTNRPEGHNVIDSVFPTHNTDDSDVHEEDGLAVASRGKELGVVGRGVHDGSRIKTFFSSLEMTFSDVKIGPHGEIPTLPYLQACVCTSQLFIRMQKMILSRVVSDIKGNVEKIRRNYALLPANSSTLQEMVLRDLKTGELGGDSTVTSLTWLNRAFRFLSKFLAYIDSGDDQTDAAKKAYGETLRNYHGFIARGMFKAAFMTLSTRKAFLHDLAINNADVDRANFETIAMEDLRGYNQALAKRLTVLGEFFDENGLPD